MLDYDDQPIQPEPVKFTEIYGFRAVLLTPGSTTDLALMIEKQSGKVYVDLERTIDNITAWYLREGYRL